METISDSFLMSTYSEYAIEGEKSGNSGSIKAAEA